MPQGQTFTMQLNQEEILYLSTKLKIPLMFGVDLRMLNLQKEDLQAVLQSAEQYLLKRDFVRPTADGNMRLAPILTAILITCAKPERTLMVTRATPNQTPNSLIYHLSQETFVNHAVDTSGVHTFILVPNLSSVLESILQLSQCKRFRKPNVQGVSLAESIYVQANKLAQANNPGSLYQLLSQNLPADTTVGIHQTLDRYEASVTVARLTHAENPAEIQSDGFTLLQGGDLQWLLRSSGEAPERMVTLEPVGVKEVRNEIRRLLKGK